MLKEGSLEMKFRFLEPEIISHSHPPLLRARVARQDIWKRLGDDEDTELTLALPLSSMTAHY